MSSLVVNTNLSAINAYNNLNATDTQMSKAIQQLSSGLAVQTAADGPAAYVQSQALQSQSNGYQQAISNAQDGVSLVQTASGALNQISSILQTMNQLAISSANGATNDSTSLAANQQEFSALQSDINQIAGTTSYGTTNLLDGTFSSQSLQVGAFNFTSQQITLSIGGASAGALGVAAGTVSVDTASHAQSAISAVQSAIASVDSIEASVGAIQNELQAIAANLTVGQQNLSAANAQLVDVNMAQTMTTFSTDQILMQTGTAMLAQAQQAPSLVEKLI
ncbi:MAG: flagellin domain protein [Acidimicrobiaceae bacterium]|jgi:flagellin|nr:flagellin domain protein [Acidimicrobiaceae bacterium]